jgi:hypothetical protein
MLMSTSKHHHFITKKPRPHKQGLKSSCSAFHAQRDEMCRDGLMMFVEYNTIKREALRRMCGRTTMRIC